MSDKEIPTQTTSPDAISAVKGIVGNGIDDETAADVVESVRAHTEKPLKLALHTSNKLLAEAYASIRSLEAELAESRKN